ncbi:MAG: ferrous iron transporter B [Candidatus Tritonobacter lacicola]|nr:ferrous iron transporter B [Candidatus Tritonobacter lacicola]
MNSIVLMGNPNVGKSVVFYRLTGVHVIASNYPGTTVAYTKGYMQIPGDIDGLEMSPFAPGEKVEIIDAPGTYTLEPTSKAEEVAVEMLKSAGMIINIIDSTNLERNLYLTMQLLETGVPMMIALNLWDETKHRGVSIDVDKLEALLGVPVVPTVAVTGEGIRELLSRIPNAAPGKRRVRFAAQRWAEIGTLIREAQTLTHHHHTLIERLEDLSVRPVSGLAIAGAVIYLYFKAVRWIGEGLIGYVMEPFFENIYAPLLDKLSAVLHPGSMIHGILIGNLVDGKIDFVESFGMLSTGIFVPVAMVLPYIFAFYLLLSFLEDFGYLPRLAVLLDTLLHRIGLHGYAIIPNMLGLGCNVPAIMATRILESRRERFIACTLISIGVPCAALQAMIFGLVGERGGQYVAVIYATMFMTWLILGLVLNQVMKGFSPELILEIPSYRVPNLPILMKKVWARVRGFLREALPVILAGVFVVNILYSLGLFGILAGFTAPVMEKLLGLPRDAIAPILIGFLRKDMALGMLETLDTPLSVKQLVVASTVLAMFFPCIATFTVLLRELGVKDMLKATLIMVTVSLAAGSILNLIL